jgi:hypothetical protein
MKCVRLMFRFWMAFAAGTALSFAGCSASTRPTPVDPAQAREALRLTLETWKKGERPGSLSERQPPIHVVDHQWRGGYQLVRYQLGSEGEIGVNLRCQVQLSLRNSKGKSLHKKAIYSVGTSPVLTVLREEDP